MLPYPGAGRNSGGPLDGQATQTTVALVSMIVSRYGSDINIADRVIGLGAESRDKAVAEAFQWLIFQSTAKASG